MSQENDYDFRDQHNILILEMLTNPYVDMVTKNVLRSDISRAAYGKIVHLVILT